MSNANFLTISSYLLTIASSATPQPISSGVAPQPYYSRDVVIQAPAANSGLIYVGNSSGQFFEIAKGTNIRLSMILNNQGQSGKFVLNQIYIKAATSGDSAEILLINPTLQGD